VFGLNFDKDDLDREAHYLLWKEWFSDVWCNPTDKEAIERVIDLKQTKDFLPAPWDAVNFCPRKFKTQREYN
jgi:hypothetical protein